MSFFQELKDKIQSFETDGGKKLLARRVFNSLIGGARPRLDSEYDWNPTYQQLLDEAQKDRKPTQTEVNAYYDQLVAENFAFQSNVPNEIFRTKQRKNEAKRRLIAKRKKEAIVNEDGTLQKCSVSRDWGSAMPSNVTVSNPNATVSSVWCSGICLLCSEPNILVQNKPCNHAFCLGCWRSSLLMEERDLTCPLAGCSQQVSIPDRLFVELVREEAQKDRVPMRTHVDAYYNQLLEKHDADDDPFRFRSNAEPQQKNEAKIRLKAKWKKEENDRVKQDRKKAQRLYEKWHRVEEGRTSYPVLNDSDEMFSPPCPTCKFQTVIPRNHSQFLLCQQMTRKTGVRDPLVKQYVNGNINPAFAFNSKNNFGKCMTVFCIKPTCTRRMALQWVDPTFGCNALCDTRHSDSSKCLKCGRKYYNHEYSQNTRHTCANGSNASFKVDCGPNCQATHDTLCEKCGKSNKDEDIYYSTGGSAHASRPYNNAPLERGYYHYCLFDKEGNLLQGTAQNPLPRGFFPTDPSKVTLVKKGYWINHGHFVEQGSKGTPVIHLDYEEKNPGIPMDGMGGSKYIWWTKLDADGDGFVLSNPHSEFKFDKFLEDKGDRTSSNITFVEEDCTNHARRFKDKSVYDLAYELYEFIIEKGLPNKPNEDLQGKYVMPCPVCQSLKEYREACEHMKCGYQDYDQTTCKGENNGIIEKERSSQETVTVYGQQTTFNIYEGAETRGTYTNFCRSCFNVIRHHQSTDSCRNYASARKIWGTLLLNADPEVRKRIPITGIESLPEDLIHAVLNDIDKVTTPTTKHRYGVIGRPGHKRTTQNERNDAKQQFKKRMQDEEAKQNTLTQTFYAPYGEYNGEAFDPTTIMSLRTVRQRHATLTYIPKGKGKLTLYDERYHNEFVRILENVDEKKKFGDPLQEYMKNIENENLSERKCAVYDGEWDNVQKGYENTAKGTLFKEGTITLYTQKGTEEVLKGSFDTRIPNVTYEKFSGMYKTPTIEFQGMLFPPDVDVPDNSYPNTYVDLQDIIDMSNNFLLYFLQHPHYPSHLFDYRGIGLLINDWEFLGTHAYMGRFNSDSNEAPTYHLHLTNNSGFIVKQVDLWKDFGGNVYIRNPINKKESVPTPQQQNNTMNGTLNGNLDIIFIAKDRTMVIYIAGKWNKDQLSQGTIRRTKNPPDDGNAEIQEFYRGKFYFNVAEFKDGAASSTKISTLEDMIRFYANANFDLFNSRMKTYTPAKAVPVKPNTGVKKKKKKKRKRPPISGGAKKRKQRESKSGITLKAHTDTVNVVIKLNEYTIVTGGHDNTLIVWGVKDLLENKSTKFLFTVLRGHTSFVSAVVKLNETTIVSGSGDGTLLAWDLSDMNNVTSQELVGGHHQEITSLIKLNDTTIVSGSTDHTLQVWDVSDLNIATFNVLRGHTSYVLSVVKFNETTIVSGSRDKTLRVWDLSDINNITSRVWRGHTDSVNVVMKWNDTTIVSGSSDATLRVWDLSLLPLISSKKYILSKKYPISSLVKWNNFIISGGPHDQRSNIVRKWDIKTGQSEIIEDLASVNSLALMNKTWIITVPMNDPAFEDAKDVYLWNAGQWWSGKSKKVKRSKRNSHNKPTKRPKGLQGKIEKYRTYFKEKSENIIRKVAADVNKNFTGVLQYDDSGLYSDEFRKYSDVIVGLSFDSQKTSKKYIYDMSDSDISSDYIGKQLRDESGEYLRYPDGRIIQVGDIVDYYIESSGTKFGNCKVIGDLPVTYGGEGPFVRIRCKTNKNAKPSQLKWKSSERKMKVKKPSSSSSIPPPNVIDLFDDEAESGAESEPESGEF